MNSFVQMYASPQLNRRSIIERLKNRNDRIYAQYLSGKTLIGILATRNKITKIRAAHIIAKIVRHTRDVKGGDDSHISVLKMPEKVNKALIQEGVTTIGALTSYNEDLLKQFMYVGRIELLEIKNALIAYGLDITVYPVIPIEKNERLKNNAKQRLERKSADIKRKLESAKKLDKYRSRNESIKKEYEAGDITMRSLSLKYDVSIARIRQIIEIAKRRSAITANAKEDSLLHLGLPVRTLNSLIAEGIESTNDLVLKSEEQVLNYINMGKLSLSQIKTALASRGLALAEPERRPQLKP